MLINRLLRKRIQVDVTILGVVRERVVRYNGRVRVREGADVRAVLAAAGTAARIDLMAALEGGDQPTILLNERRLDLPDDLTLPLTDRSRVSWLMPMTGG